MKISREIASSQPIKQVQPQRKIDGQFQQLVQSQSKQIKNEELIQLMDKITEQGEKLVRYRSFQDLVRYKNLIKGFLEKTVYDSYELDSSFHFSPRGESKQLATVKKIDEKLAELTEEIMEQEKGSVHLLDIIGEIKGLLINLYG